MWLMWLVRVRLIGYTNEWGWKFLKTAVLPGDDDVPILTSPVMFSFHDGFFWVGMLVG